jgi:hypothetical protein
MPQPVTQDNERVLVYATDEEVLDYFRRNPKLEASVRERRKQLSAQKTNLFPVVSLKERTAFPSNWKFNLHLLIDYAIKGQHGRYTLYKAEDFVYFFGGKFLQSIPAIPTDMTDLSQMLFHVQEDTQVPAQAVFKRIHEQLEAIMAGLTKDYRIYELHEGATGLPYGLGFSVMPGINQEA